MPRKPLFRLALLCALPLVTQCTGIPEGLEPVRDFDLDGYLGTWHEIARLNHRFERGLTAVTANYSLRDDGGIMVVNRGYNAEAGEWEEAVGKAYPVDTPDVGRLKVSFFGPFYGGYNVIALERQPSECSMVAGPSRSYLWILCRATEPNSAQIERLVATAGDLGFATDELIFVSHRSPAVD
ncbi:MAG: lipocalin family protein [Pseudomonadota bacterium]